jgi:transcriptional regulator with XRE-family HTH domain
MTNRRPKRGRHLEAWLLYVGMSQRALAELADLSPVTVAQIVRGKNNSRGALRFISTAIEVPYDILTEHGPDDPEARSYADAALKKHIARKMAALQENCGMRALTGPRAANFFELTM